MNTLIKNNSLLTGTSQCNPDWKFTGSNYWPKYQCSMSKTIASATVADTTITPGGTVSGTFLYFGGVLLPDGRVFLVPTNAGVGRIYNPQTNALTLTAGNDGGVTWPTGSQGGWAGGVLLRDGRVFCVPSNALKARIYDPVQNTVTTPSPEFRLSGQSGSAFAGGVLMSDGRVFCVPHNMTGGNPKIYNPASDSVDIVGGTWPANGSFLGGVLLKDGRVFLCPTGTAQSGYKARIYDPATNTTITPGGTYPDRAGSLAFYGGVLMADGRVFVVPFGNTTARIYDPVADTVTTPNGTYPGGGAFAGGVLLPNGNVFMVPYNSTSAYVYNPYTNSASVISGSYPGSNAYRGGVLLKDGRVYCIPASTSTARIYGGGGGFDENVVLSGYYNKF